MARPLRIMYEGAWYHLISRGINKRNIYCTNEHYRYFLTLLGIVSEKFQAEIHAYCLMSNHYHILMRTPKANLSTIMRYINGVYTQKFNFLMNRDGSLFKGRYFSSLVDSDSYLLSLSRYIHLNPVAANMVGKPASYTWSSYSSYLSGQAPEWLQTSETMSHFRSSKNYREYVENSPPDKFMEQYFATDKKPAILGSDNFVQYIKDNYIDESHLSPEIPDRKLFE